MGAKTGGFNHNFLVVYTFTLKVQPFEINGFYPAKMYSCAKIQSDFRDEVDHLGMFTLFNIFHRRINWWVGKTTVLRRNHLMLYIHLEFKGIYS